MVVSRKLISLSDISAVNLIEGWCLFARTMNSSISFLSVLHNEKILSMYLFHSRGLVLLKFRISVSTTEMKMLAKATCHLYTHCGSVCFFTWLRKFSSIRSRNVGCKLMWDWYCTFMLWSSDSCQYRVSADLNCMTLSRAQGILTYKAHEIITGKLCFKPAAGLRTRKGSLFYR